MCSHCGKVYMKESFMLALERLREACDFPFIISSGYRCPDHNAAVSPATGRDGPHTTGYAADVAVVGDKAYMVMAKAHMVGMTGVGLNQKGPHNQRFVHLDTLNESSTRPRPWVWTY